MPAGSPNVHEHAWLKSSYSGANTTECVEAAFVASGVLVRDSKQGNGPVVVVRPQAWLEFIGSLSRGKAGVQEG
jgi:hypothetical protein